MYKVILVDDDELVRVGLESLVQFSQKGFQIIDALSSTQAALKSIYKNQPDVVIIGNVSCRNATAFSLSARASGYVVRNFCCSELP